LPTACETINSSPFTIYPSPLPPTSP
jgi:hypothetical protein